MLYILLEFSPEVNTIESGSWKYQCLRASLLVNKPACIIAWYPLTGPGCPSCLTSGWVLTYAGAAFGSFCFWLGSWTGFPLHGLPRAANGHCHQPLVLEATFKPKGLWPCCWCHPELCCPQGTSHQCIASKHCLCGLLHEKSRWPVSSWLAAGSGGLESALCYWCCLCSCSALRPSCLKAAGPSGAVVSVQGLPWFCSSALTCRAPGSEPAQLLWHYQGPAEPMHLSGSCCLPFSPHPKQLSSEAPLMLAFCRFVLIL